MTQREEIQALRAEVARLCDEVEALRVQVAQAPWVQHHHYHHPPAPPAPISPSIAPYPWTSPNICQTSQSVSAIRVDPHRTIVLNGPRP